VGDLDFDSAAVEILARRAKAELRKRARGVRKSSPKAAIEARSQEIVARLLGMPAVVNAAHVAIFDAIVGRNEVELASFGRALRGRGVHTYYPAIDPETRDMVFRDPGDPEAMQEYGFGFREPDPAIPAATKLDVVIVPALRADGRGHRLGYGAGYYDRTLPGYCPPATSIIVVFDFELAPELPLTPGDFPCDWVVTDKRSIEVSNAPL
jgi:5-formyltetrahydrofolate cyclo-ligase